MYHTTTRAYIKGMHVKKDPMNGFGQTRMTFLKGMN